MQTLTRGRWRVGINAHLLSRQPGFRQAGIHQYIVGLLNHMPSDSRIQSMVFTNCSATLDMGEGHALISSRWPTAAPMLRIAWEQFAWPLLASRYQLDLLHGLGFVTPIANRRPAVVTVYDLSFLHYPERYPFLKRTYLNSQSRRSCRKARRVVTISEASRQDIAEQYGLAPEQIEIVSPGVGRSFLPLPNSEVERFRQRKELPSQFFLHVGTLQPRKNLPVLFEALARLGRPEVPLVLVGGPGWHVEEIYAKVNAFQLADRIRFAGYVSDAELPLWYNAATALVFPSLYEGFGMPVAQAMACGTPVITSNASAMPEVAGTAGLLFDPADVSTLAKHMATVLDEPHVVATMREEGLDRAGRYTWPKAGKAMHAIYEQALKGE